MGTHSYPRAQTVTGKRGVGVGDASPDALSWPQPTAAGKGPSTGLQLLITDPALQCYSSRQESISQRKQNLQLKIPVVVRITPGSKRKSTEGGHKP